MPVSIQEALFRPRGIAIVGASNEPAKLLGRPLDYLIKLGYQGAIVSVNPTRTLVQGVPSYPSLAVAKVQVDLAVVVVPAPAVAQALRDCAAAGVAAAIVFASGFAEMGGRGGPMQQEIEEICRTTGLRAIGPNCLGTFALPSKAFATLSSAFDEEGVLPDDAIALVSQSGAVSTFIYASMVATGVGVRYFANTGNEVDVSVGELLGSLAESQDVDILIGYLEDARRLGALEDAAGDAAMLFRQGRRAGDPKVAIVTSSGGASALTTDAAVQIGLRIDALSPSTADAILPLLPEYGSVANPVDLTGALLNDLVLIRKALEHMAADPAIDILLVVLGNADRGGEALVEGIAEVCAQTRKPFVVRWSGGSGRPRQSLMARRIPTYAEPLRAIRANGSARSHTEGI